MPHSTTGRRHPRAGSVTVTELMHREPPPETGKADAVATPAEHREQLGPLATAGKIAGIGVGVLALCGAIGVTPMLTANHANSTQRAGAPTLALSGVQALLPDRLAAQLRTPSAGDTRQGAPLPSPVSTTSDPKTTAASTRHTTRASATSGGNRYGVAVRPTTSVAGREAATSTTASGTTPAQIPPADLVRQFYQLASDNPDAAAQLLDPGLLGSSLGGFVQSWHAMRALRVEHITQTSASTATAVVRMLQPDGSWLRATELFTTTQGAQPLITGVELLSAQHG
ncbi:MAG: hypothetical protein ACRDRN_07365 [Sciscionella sp.]